MEPMSIDNNLVELTSHNVATPIGELITNSPPTTSIHTVDTNNTPVTNNKPKLLTQEQAESIKLGLSKLLKQASALTTANPDRSKK